MVEVKVEVFTDVDEDTGKVFVGLTEGDVRVQKRIFQRTRKA